MRSLVRLVAAVAVVLLGLAPVAAYGAWKGAGTGQGSATATTVNRAAAPTASRGTGKVTLTWASVTLASGTPVTSYDVVRHSGATTTTVCSAVVVRTCDDLAPLPGAVQYGVVARIGASWRGAEGPSTSFTYDQTAPVTTLSTTPTAANGAGWFHGDVTVTLAATDPGGALASGVKEIHYTVNGGSAVVAAGSSTSFVVNQEQVNTLTYGAVDNVGNTEAPVNQAQVKLDKTAPVTTITPASSTSWTTTRTVSLSATDATSGVASIVYRIDGGAVTTYTGAFTLADGAHAVTYHALDAAGNVEVDRTATVKVDTTAPSSSISPASSTTPLTATITGTDASSGVASIAYKLDGAASYTVVAGSSASVSVPTSNHTVTWHAVDAAGNVEADHTVIYGDTTGPTVTPTEPAQGGSYATGTAGNGSWAKVCGTGHVCANVTDVSGLASVTYTLTGTAGTNSGKCWSGTSFVSGSACSVSMTGSGNVWSGSDIARGLMGATTWSLTYKATDPFGNLTTVTITFSTT